MRSKLFTLRYRLLWAGCILFLTACRLVNMEPVEVTSVYPEHARVDNPSEVDAVRLSMSATPDRQRVESAFSLTADGVPTAGRFEWRNSTVQFRPYEPIRRGFDYVISLTSDAQDIHGNGMLQDFEHEFTTRTSPGRPEVVSVFPQDGERIATQGQQFHINFDRSVDPASFYEALSISPSIPYAVEWDGDRSKASVRPVRALTAQQEYTLTLATTLTDENNRSLAQRFEHSVVAGESSTAPRLLSVGASFERAPISWLELQQNTFENVLRPALTLHPGRALEADIEPTVEWETFWDITMEFDRPVSSADLDAVVEIDPEVTYSLEPSVVGSSVTPGYSRTWRIAPIERLEYDRRYTLRLEGPVRDEQESELELDDFAVFRTNGPASLPPSLDSVRFLVNPLETDISEPLSDEDELDLLHYPTGTERGTLGFFDLYISVAAGAQIDPFEMIEQFSITADNLAASFELVGVQSSTTGVVDELDPQPVGDSPAQAEENEQVIRVWLAIEDNERSGLVRMTVGDGVTDTYGNAPAIPWRLRLNQVSTP